MELCLITIRVLLQSERMSTQSVYPPSDEFVRKAHVQGMKGYLDLYRRAEKDPEEFWGEIAEREIHWFEKWSKVLEWNPPFARWFADAKLNVSYNCLDRHLTTPRKNKVAILWGRRTSGEQRAHPARNCIDSSSASPVSCNRAATKPATAP